MASKCHKVIQRKLKTIRDLKHHLKINGPARHVIHDSETDWWWFADNRNHLLEEIFNAGSPLVFAPKARSAKDGGETLEIQSDFNTQLNGFRLTSPFLSPKMTDGMLTELFWTDFLNQEQERFAYWDMGNPDNGFEAYLFYREMSETGAYLEAPIS
jgi:hypothetical protein